jgi:hypothetical protein
MSDTPKGLADRKGHKMRSRESRILKRVTFGLVIASVAAAQIRATSNHFLAFSR